MIGLGAAAGLFYCLKEKLPKVMAHESDLKKDVSKQVPGSYIEGMPVYTSDEVSKHCNESTGIWISYKSGVYDITSFVKSHPGCKIVLISTHFKYFN